VQTLGSNFWQQSFDLSHREGLQVLVLYGTDFTKKISHYSGMHHERFSVHVLVQGLGKYGTSHH
jgi:hypothetical protein